MRTSLIFVGAAFTLAGIGGLEGTLPFAAGAALTLIGTALAGGAALSWARQPL